MAYRPIYKKADGTSADLPLDAETVQGIDVIEELRALSSGAQIATGSYVGTGNYGANQRTSLSFEFVPKFLWVQAEFWSNSRLSWLGGSAYTRRNSGTNSAWADEGTVSISGTMISWYNTASAERQLNESGKTYYYFAIG